MTVVTPIDRPNSFRNHCVIERFEVSLYYFDLHCLSFRDVSYDNVRSLPFSLKVARHILVINSRTDYLTLQDTNMLFTGGLIFAVAMEEVNLHRRIAVGVTMLLGSRMNT